MILNFTVQVEVTSERDMEHVKHMLRNPNLTHSYPTKIYYEGIEDEKYFESIEKDADIQGLLPL